MALSNIVILPSWRPLKQVSDENGIFYPKSKSKSALKYENFDQKFERSTKIWSKIVIFGEFFSNN